MHEVHKQSQSQKECLHLRPENSHLKQSTNKHTVLRYKGRHEGGRKKTKKSQPPGTHDLHLQPLSTLYFRTPGRLHHTPSTVRTIPTKNGKRGVRFWLSDGATKTHARPRKNPHIPKFWPHALADKIDELTRGRNTQISDLSLDADSTQQQEEEQTGPLNSRGLSAELTAQLQQNLFGDLETPKQTKNRPPNPWRPPSPWRRRMRQRGSRITGDLKKHNPSGAPIYQRRTGNRSCTRRNSELPIHSQDI